MNLVTDNIKTLYFKYLALAFWVAILPSIYGVVDMIVVGQYYGPIGSAAMTIIAPIWNVVYSFGLLTGIGSSILFNITKNAKEKDINKANGFFSVGLIFTAIIAIILCLILIFFDDKILMIFGADNELLPLAKSYLIPVKIALPVFLFMQFFAAFLRNDGNPKLATKAVVVGGVFNIFADIFLVFTLDMGILGAGLATCIGAAISLSVMMLHFKKKENSLKLVPPTNIIKKSKQITTVGFSTFFVDIAMGILTMLFNIQIMKYLGSDALAIYGIIVNISTFAQCCAYGVGQASQPILSANYSSNNFDRIKTLFKYNIITIIIISFLWIVATMTFPTAFVYAFMSPTASVLEIAPSIIRIYCVSFILLPFNIFITYYFQSIMKPRIAFIISIARGLLISGTLIIILPLIFTKDSLWLAMVITEIITLFIVIVFLKNNKLN